MTTVEPRRSGVTDDTRIPSPRMSATHDPAQPRPGQIMRDLKAASIEFIGTNAFFLLLYGGLQTSYLFIIEDAGDDPARTVPVNWEQTLYYSLVAGGAMLAASWMFYRTVGGLFNPAVSLGLLLIREISIIRFVLYLVAQIAGSISAAAIIDALLPGPFLPITRLGQRINIPQGLFIEMFATAFLLLAVFLLASERRRYTPLAPIGLAVTYFITHMWSAPLTGASLNPARSFGAQVIQGFRDTETYHWIYWLGPVLGVLLAYGIYFWLKFTSFWGPQDTYGHHDRAGGGRYDHDDYGTGDNLTAAERDLGDHRVNRNRGVGTGHTGTGTGRHGLGTRDKDATMV